MSLDGCIAGPSGESDWIVMDPDIDIGALMGAFDTVLLGRRTFEATRQQGGGGMPGMQKDIWLFGGGGLFRSMLERRLVDSVELAVIRVLLGGGVPLLPRPAKQAKPKFMSHRIYPKTGTASLVYEPA